ncbi:MAG: MarR family transcriptional regulator [Chloroflexota bacterium]|nr:MarR family transcriptional regulator [Chloroflexota bacterium]
MKIFDSIGSLLVRLGRAHRNLIRREMRCLGLCRGQPPVLFALNERDGTSNSEMAKFLEITPATLTNKVKRMEKAQLVIRRRDPQDERVNRIYLTTKGRGLLDDLHVAMKAIENILLDDFSESQAQVFKESLQKVVENIEQHLTVAD